MMPIKQSGPVHYYSFENLADKALLQAVFTRLGGVSPAPWAELNLGGSVGDDPDRVAANRKRALGALERAENSVFDVWQVHSDKVVIADQPRPTHVPHQKADAIITNNPDVTLVMRFADCVPIFLYDPVHKVIGLVHAGWQGTVTKVVAAAIRTMRSHFESNPVDIQAGIGPSIGPDHYQVGPDVVDRVKIAFGADAFELMPGRDGKIHFDLWRANELILRQEGVRSIEISGLCTACDLDHWFSHRAEKGMTGRFGALIALKS